MHASINELTLTPKILWAAFVGFIIRTVPLIANANF